MSSPAILLDARLVLERPTGIGQYLSALIPELLRQAPDLHFHLLRSPRPWEGYDLQGWRAPNLTQHVSTLAHMSPRQQLALPLFARAVGARLLHYPHFDAPVLLPLVPVVATIYDAKYLVRPDFFTRLSRAKRLYMRASYALTLRHARAVLTISEATAGDLRRLFRVPAGRLHVTPLAADPQFRPAGEVAARAFRKRHALPRPFILCVGEVRPHKNHLGLIRAYAQSQGRATHDLVLIGQRYQDYDAPQQLVEQLGLTERVRFLHDVDASGLVAAYSAASVVALVSFYEGFGLPILEAMACGTSVVAASSTATGEVAGPGALRVDPHDPAAIAHALDTLLLDPVARHHWLDEATRWQQRFTWQRTAQQTLAVYRATLAAQPKRGP